MTFEKWWYMHDSVGVCLCRGSCVYKVYNQQESWAKDKVKKRLKQDYHITDETQEFPHARESADVQSESIHQAQ